MKIKGWHLSLAVGILLGYVGSFMVSIEHWAAFITCVISLVTMTIAGVIGVREYM